jgi:hypothetical protein
MSENNMNSLFPFRIEDDLSPIEPKKKKREIISSIGYDQLKILHDIVGLYCANKIDCDPTYSIGNFYKSGLVPQPRLKFDLTPQVEGVKQADSRHLPLEKESVESIVFDPPFVSGTASNGKRGIIKERFSYMRKVKDLWVYYNESMNEFYRVLKPNGILVFKCQDSVEDHKNFFSHCEIMNQALNIGFEPVDVFILMAKNRIIQKKLNAQQHARKFHSYFWVFEKRKNRIPYGIGAYEIRKQEVKAIDNREEVM